MRHNSQAKKSALLALLERAWQLVGEPGARICGITTRARDRRPYCQYLRCTPTPKPSTIRHSEQEF